MTKPKERRIIFPGPDADAKIRAVLKGRLTRHSWPMNPQPLDVITKRAPWADSATRTIAGKRCWCAKYKDNPPRGKMIYCRQCEVGQRLWVAEAWQKYAGRDIGDRRKRIVYRASVGTWPMSATLCPKEWRWEPSTHMPRELSRIDLEVTGVGAHTLHATGPDEALAEGVMCIEQDPSIDDDLLENPRERYRMAWDATYAKRGLGWDANPWVFWATFVRVKP